jgi:hypothetical protein
MRITLFYQPGELEYKLKAQSKGFEVEYVGDDPDYWSKDIDFILNGNIAVEVKWDAWIDKTGNLFIETINPRSKNGIGWYNFIEADYLAYGNSKKNEFYIIKMQDLRNYINQQSPEPIKTGDGAEGYLINKEDVPHETYR